MNGFPAAQHCMGLCTCWKILWILFTSFAVTLGDNCHSTVQIGACSRAVEGGEGGAECDIPFRADQHPLYPARKERETWSKTVLKTGLHPNIQLFLNPCPPPPSRTNPAHATRCGYFEYRKYRILATNLCFDLERILYVRSMILYIHKKSLVCVGR